MLTAIAASVKRRIETRKGCGREAELRALMEHPDPVRSFAEALGGPEARYIFEIKRRSPSAGGSPLDLNVAEVAQTYERGGAACISVLTEQDFFAGSLNDLLLTRRATSVPILCKDFILDKMQILEARAHGASAVLLIATLLSDCQLAGFIQYAQGLDLDALVEVHTDTEVKRAVDAGAKIIGVNNRDLTTLSLDLQTGERLLRTIPRDCIRVAESGLRTREDVIRMRRAGADALLVGTSVVRSGNIRHAIEELMIP